MSALALLPDPASPLSFETAEAAFADILDGRVPDDAIAAFLTAMTRRDETAIEIAAAARAMRARMIEVTAPAHAIDVCGTGGDGAHSLNISTAVAIVVAAAGIPVAKHGNRAASSRAGAADTLEALGLDLDRAAARAAENLDEPRKSEILTRARAVRKPSGQLYFQRCLNSGLRFSRNAAIPSFWSSVENIEWNRRRSKLTPSARVVS